MAHGNCSFETDRLMVDEWFRLLTGSEAETKRNTFVVSLMSEAVTRDLPAGWQGRYDTERAASWFDERQLESTVLLIVDRPDGLPVGFLILSESGNSDSAREIRLGYIIAEKAWGVGLATEVVAGIVDWCRTNGTIRSIVGGVVDSNSASARVLHKNGFIREVEDAGHLPKEVEYTLAFAP